MKNKTAIITIFIFLWFLILTAFSDYKGHEVHHWDVTLAGVKLKTEIVLTSEDQAKGLSGRKSLKDDEGMLFVFPQKGRYPFWMKDMNFAIDIIWINEDNKVIYIQKDAKPDSYPETFGPNEDARYVLEVPSSFSDKNNVKVGDRVEFIH